MKKLGIKVKNKFSNGLIKIHKILNNQKGEIGVSTILGIVLVIIIFAFVIIPQGRTFIEKMFTDLTNWYNNGTNIFSTSK